MTISVVAFGFGMLGFGIWVGWRFAKAERDQDKATIRFYRELHEVDEECDSE